MDYKLYEDIKMIMQLLDIQLKDIASIMEVDVMTLYRLKNDKPSLAKESIEKLYAYAYSMGLHLNLVKSTLYEEEGESFSKLLYHGCRGKLDGAITLKKGKKNNDFGPAFYTGEGYVQAASFVASNIDSRVYVFNLCLDGLNGLELGVDLEWMIMIAYFRGRLSRYENHPYIKKLLEKLDGIDYIRAPIADNRMFMIIDTFIAGEITDMQCRHALASANLGNQYVLISEKAINSLKPIDTLYLCEEEKEYYKAKKAMDIAISNEKVRMARIKYKNQGVYIDEVLK